MLNTPKSKLVFFTIVSIIGLLAISPIIFNLNNLVGFEGRASQKIEREVDFQLDFSLEFLSYHNFEIQGVNIHFDLMITYNESVNELYVETVYYKVQHNELILISETPYSGYLGMSRCRSSTLYQDLAIEYGDNVSCEGNIDYSYEFGGVPKNDYIIFDMLYVHDLQREQVNGYLTGKTIGTFVYWASFLVVPLLLISIFIHLHRKKNQDQMN